MTETQPSTLRLLRIVRVITAAFKYCLRDFRRLFLVTWFVCVLASASRLLAEWLVYPFPQVPEWMLSTSFDPPTWLAPILIMPWLAMGWAFVLNEMFDADARRGIIQTPSRALTWIRFELSRPVLIASAILAATGLADGATRVAQFHILALAYMGGYDDNALMILAGIVAVARVALFVWCYPLAGLVLHTGRFSIADLRQLMRGNWLRVAAIVLLLTVILRGIDQLMLPVTAWLFGTLTESTVWTVQATAVRLAIDFPFQMLWTLAWGITVGIILHTLTRATVPVGGND